MHLSTTRKAFLGLLALAMLIGLLAVVSIASVRQLGIEHRRVVTGFAHDFALVERLRILQEQLVATNSAYLVTREPSYLVEYERHREAVRDTLSQLRQKAVTESGKSLLGALESETAAQDMLWAEMLEALVDPRVDVRSVFVERVRPLREELDRTLTALALHKRRMFAQAQARATEATHRAVAVIGAGTLVGLGLALALALALRRLVLREAMQRRLFESTVEAVPVGVTVLHADGKPVIANAAMRALAGEPAVATSEPALRALRGDDVRNAELRVRRAAGDERIAVINAASMRGPGGVIESVVVAATDVTEARRAVAKFRRIYESGVVSIVLTDAQGRIADANDAFLSLLGYTREELEHGAIAGTDITPPEFRPLDVIAAREAQQRGVSRPFEKDFLRKDGSRVPVLVSTAPIDEPGGAAVGVVIDVSGRKRLEREREALVAELREAVQLSELFVAILGHDLRSPLNAVTMGVQVLRDAGVDARKGRVLDRMVSSTRRMQRMIDQILDLTRIRLAGGIPIARQRVSLGALCEQVADELRQGEPTAHVTVDRLGDTFGEWDPDRLEQVVTNLMANAVHHGAERAVEVSVDGACEDRVVLRVHNDGEIPPEVLPIIFDPFRRADRGTGRAHGLGLGLFITRELVLRHGGTISVDSNAEQGTVFIVELPRGAPMSAPHRRPDDSPGANA